jgi:hypothetical protein
MLVRNIIYSIWGKIMETILNQEEMTIFTNSYSFIVGGQTPPRIVTWLESTSLPKIGFLEETNFTTYSSNNLTLRTTLMSKKYPL